MIDQQKMDNILYWVLKVLIVLIIIATCCATISIQNRRIKELRHDITELTNLITDNISNDKRQAENTAFIYSAVENIQTNMMCLYNNESLINSNIINIHLKFIDFDNRLKECNKPQWNNPPIVPQPFFWSTNYIWTVTNNCILTGVATNSIK